MAARRKPGARAPRLARRGEAQALSALVAAAYAPYQPRFGPLPAAATADFDRLIAQRRVYVLEDDGGLAAIMVAGPHDTAFVIDQIAILPDRLRRGLGRALIAYAETLARMAGLSRVELSVEEALWEAVARYYRLGYEEVDRRDDNGIARIYFRKHLGWRKRAALNREQFDDGGW